MVDDCKMCHIYNVLNNRDNKYLKEFGKHLKKLRLERSISQEALAKAAGMGRNQIWLIERGEVNPTLNTLKKLAKYIGVHPKELFDF